MQRGALLLGLEVMSTPCTSLQSSGKRGIDVCVCVCVCVVVVVVKSEVE